MNDASVMRADERAGNLDAATNDYFGRQSGIRAHLAQGLAFNQLHHDVKLALRLADVVDGANIGMSKGAGGTRFLKKILAC